MQESPYIYESSDGGRTVYRRLANSTERERITVKLTDSPSELVERRALLRRLRWYSMLDAAADDPILNSMIEKVETYYALKY